MRLLCIHEDTVQALRRLHTPFDDLTPDGVWGTSYHLVGVNVDQRDVLRAFNVDLEDVTPRVIDRGAAAVVENLAYATPEPRNGQKLRTAHRGQYVEAVVQDGRIVLDGRAFDSPAAASRSLTPDKTEWAFWELYDDSAGDWKVLGREWRV